MVRRPAPADMVMVEPAAIVVRRPAPIFIRNPVPAVVVTERRTGGLHSLGQRDRVLQRVVGSVPDGGDEHAQAKGRPAVIHEDDPLFIGLANFLIDAGSSPSAATGTSQRRDVSAEEELGRLSCFRGQAGRRTQPRQQEYCCDE